MKSKCFNREEFVVVGWTDPAGSRSHIGALLLGYYTEDGRLHYAGRAGTGIAAKELERLARLLASLQVPRMPLAEPPPRDSRFGSPLQLSKVHVAGNGGRSELPHLDGGQPVATGLLPGAAAGQTGAASRGACSLSRPVPTLGLNLPRAATSWRSSVFLGGQPLSSFVAGRSGSACHGIPVWNIAESDHPSVSRYCPEGTPSADSRSRGKTKKVRPRQHRGPGDILTWGRI